MMPDGLMRRKSFLYVCTSQEISKSVREQEKKGVARQVEMRHPVEDEIILVKQLFFLKFFIFIFVISSSAKRERNVHFRAKIVI